MPRLSVLAALLGCGSAQLVCKDDANFQSDLPFKTGYGPSGTCGEWRDAHFTPVRDTYDQCLAKVTITLNGVAGNTSMPAGELQEYMAKPGDGLEGAGCCGDSPDGAACDPFKDMVPVPPCAEGTQEEDGQCFPCYNHLVDGDCVSCFGGDTRGCTQEECTPEMGVWDRDEDMCRACNTMSLEGCDESACADMGGNWDEWEDRCMSCRPEFGDVWGCTEQQCREAEGMWRTWEDDGRMRGSCSLCRPEMNWLDGCSEGQCVAEMANNSAVNWKCWGGATDCRCSICSIDGSDYGSWRNCGEHQCKPTAEAMDVRWKEVWGTWECVRCFRNGDDRDSRGCDDAMGCNAIDGFEWRHDCDPSWGDQCCNECFHDSFWGCQSHSSCVANGGHWCDSYCTRREDCASSPSPGPSGNKIPEHDCNMFSGMTAPGSTHNYMMNSDEVTPWLSAWNVTIVLQMPSNIDMMYGEAWLGLLGSDGGHPYPYFGYGRLMLERQNGPHPGVAHIDVRQAGLMENEWYLIEAGFTPPDQWYLAIKEKTEEQAIRADISWNYEYKDENAFVGGPIVAGSGYVDGESFSGTIGCVTFRGDMALHYGHEPAPAPRPPPGGVGGRCGSVPQTAIDAAKMRGFEPRYC